MTKLASRSRETLNLFDSWGVVSGSTNEAKVRANVLRTWNDMDEIA